MVEGAAPSRFSVPARPFQAPATAGEGLDLETWLSRSERFGHHLERLTTRAEPPRSTSLNAPIQGVFLKEDGTPYKDITKSRWYQNLGKAEREEAVRMHKDQAVIKFSDTLTAIKQKSTHGLPKAPKQTFSFMDELPLGSITPTKVVPDDLTLEQNPKKAKIHHESLVLEKLTAAKKRYLKEPDSSDSETETGPDRDRQQRRRQYKASRLAAIARTFFPLEASELGFHENLDRKRKRDNDAHVNTRQMYAQDTRVDLAQMGEHMKLTNLYHNPYFRRAFRKAIPNDKVEKGGSVTYDAVQGKIRNELLSVIQADHASMKWTRQDFPDDKTWDAVQFMFKNTISNSGKEDSYHERVESGQDTSGSTPKMAFHHIAWKEALGGKLAPFALTPMNLSALNDLRQLLNPKKIEALQNQGKALPPIGGHDKAHQSTGFRSDKKSDFKLAEGGGHFKDIDVEALLNVLETNLEKRTPKKELYNVDSGTGTASTPSSVLTKRKSSLSSISGLKKIKI